MRGSEFATRGAVVLVALVVFLAAATPASAASGRVELDAALDDQTESTDLTFTFTATANESVSATGSRSAAGGDVEFTFDRWEDLDGGGSGGGTSWTVTDGHTYRVTYEASASSGVSEGTYSESVSITGGTSGTVDTETLSLEVDLLEPRFGSIGTVSEEFVFTSSGENSQSIDVDFDNDGEGVMRPTDVSVSGTPSGMSVSVDSLSDQVDGFGTGQLTLEVTADSSVSTGTHDVSVTISDNLGNSESFSLEVTVRKPPVLSVDDSVDAGGVVRGESGRIDVTVSESAGFQGIDGLDYDIIGVESNGNLEVRGTSGVSTNAGGSDSVTFVVTAEDGAEQHERLSWQVRLTPNNQYSPSVVVDVDARVLYRGRLGAVSTRSRELQFDEPQSQASEFTTETTVAFENTGDLDLEVVDVTAAFDRPGLEARVVDAPNTVGGLSNGSATVELTAASDMPEGTYPFEVRVRGEDADNGANDETKVATGQLRVRQFPQLEVERTDLSFGDVPPAERRTLSTDVSEILEYKSVSNLTIRQTGGQGGWLRIVERPSSLSPGETASLVFALEFNTSAEPFRSYTWSYVVTGRDVEPTELTVSARADLVNFDTIRQNLSAYEADWNSEISGNMNDALGNLENRMTSGDPVQGSDLSRTVVASRTALLFLDSVEDARAARRTNGSAAAQPHVIRAAATYNAMASFVDSLETPAIRRPASESLSAARSVVRAELATQREHYTEVLEADDVTTLERAQAQRELARIAEFRGNQERAEELRQASNRAFDRYQGQVGNATQARQAGREEFSTLQESATIVVAGQPLVLNPARLDAVQSRVDRIDARYATAAETLAAAGADAEAQQVRRERSSVAATLETTMNGLYAATGLYALVALVVSVQTSRNLYAYVQDARVAALSDAIE